jgi:hypothetical protein
MRDLPSGPSQDDEFFASCLIQFNRTGDDMSMLLFNEDRRNVKSGFGSVSGAGLYFSGFRQLPSKFFPSMSDISGSLFKEYKISAGNKCHPDAAGIVTILNRLQKPGMEITGNEIKSLITMANPSFSVDHPSLFKTLMRIRVLKNENGIVSLETIDNKQFIFGSLRLDNGARFNISVFDNNDISVGIISGFKMALNRLPFYLNNLLIDYSSGKLVIDYDHDHTLKTVSIRTMFYAK